MTMSSRPLVLGIDAGGTMTDTFLVAEDGTFALGKAATTPADESIGFIESAADAASQWDLQLAQTFPELAVVLYAGTTMLNTLLSRTGKRLGLLVTAGFEDSVQMGRGMQVWAGYSYADRLHSVTHAHPAPLVPRRRIRGVSERIDLFGDIVIPLYEHEVVIGTNQLLEENVEAICVSYLFSFVNPEHELRTREVIHGVLAERGAELPVLLAHEIRPVLREHSRLNSTLIEAYAAAPVREQLFKVEHAVQERGLDHSLQTVLSYGGLANIRYPRLHETLMSGPVGGVLGAKFVGDLIGEQNIVVTDMGGTSFDVGAITQGVIPIDNEPVLARFKLSLPTIALDSIGAGSGTIIKVDPVTNKLELGPESAGSHPGPVCFDQGGDRVTICDCDLVLGYLNPDNFLGGKLQLNVEKAEAALREQVTDRLGVDVHAGAEGIVQMLEADARLALQQIISARGYEPSSYTLMAYGGSGPLHVAGYAGALHFKRLLTFPFAAAFSAFGCTTADFLHRYSMSVRLELSETVDEAEAVDGELRTAWARLEEQARAEFADEAIDTTAATFDRFVMMRYSGQLDDIEVPLHVHGRSNGNGVAPLDLSPTLALVSRFEDIYERINRKVAKYPKVGYSITEVGLTARISTPKPRFTRHQLGAATPPHSALRGTRAVYRDGRWSDAQILDMDGLLPGNVVEGLAVIEHSMTTLVVPAGWRVTVDQWGFLWLEEGDGR